MRSRGRSRGAAAVQELCAQWTLLNWDPDELITRYKKAGARVVVALANHHCNFDAWDSQRQPARAQGTGASVDWKQQAEVLRVELPKNYRPKVDYAAALKLSLS